jgi:hypothetical protein
MPSDRVDDDPAGTVKQNHLRRIGQRLLDGKPFLPPGPWYHKALWQKIAWRFETGTWPSAPLKKMAPRSRSLKSKWTLLGVLLALTVCVIWIIALGRQKDSDEAPSIAAQTRNAKEPTPSPPNKPKTPRAAPSKPRRVSEQRQPSDSPDRTAEDPHGASDEDENAHDPPAQAPATEVIEVAPQEPAEWEHPVEQEPDDPVQVNDETPPTAELPDYQPPEPETVPHNPPSEPPETPLLPAQVTVTTRRDFSLRPPAIVGLKPVTSGAGGKPVPLWFRNRFRIACETVGEFQDGLESHPIEIPETEYRAIHHSPTLFPLPVLFKVLPPRDELFDERAETLAATEWHRIGALEEKTQYTIRLELGPEEIEQIRALADP